MTLIQRIRLAWQLVLGRAPRTLDWGAVKAQAIPLGDVDDTMLVLLTADEAERLLAQ